MCYQLKSEPVTNKEGLQGQNQFAHYEARHDVDGGDDFVPGQGGLSTDDSCYHVAAYASHAYCDSQDGKEEMVVDKSCQNS